MAGNRVHFLTHSARSSLSFFGRSGYQRHEEDVCLELRVIEEQTDDSHPNAHPQTAASDSNGRATVPHQHSLSAQEGEGSASSNTQPLESTTSPQDLNNPQSYIIKLRVPDIASVQMAHHITAINPSHFSCLSSWAHLTRMDVEKINHKNCLDFLKDLPKSVKYMSLSFTQDCLVAIPRSISACKNLKTIELIYEWGTPASQQQTGDTGTGVGAANEDRPEHQNVEIDGILDCLAESLSNMSGLSSLDSLKLGNNKLHLLPDEITSLKNLINLDLSGNNFSELPPFLSEMMYLEELCLDGNPDPLLLARTVPKERTINVRLEHGTTPQKEEYGVFCEPKSKSLRIKTLNAEKFKELSVKYLSSFAQMEDIKRLSWRSNQLTQIPDDLLPYLTSVQTLDLTKNNLKNLDKALTHLKSLNELLLGGNSGLEITTSLKSFLARLCYWEVDGVTSHEGFGRSLSLNGGRLVVNELNVLTNLKSHQTSHLGAIRSLDISETRPSDLRDINTHRMTNITYLCLRRCDLTTLPDKVSCLTKLLVLDVSDNRLHDLKNIPGDALVDLNISNNHLTSIVEVETISELESINVSSNRLTSIQLDLSKLTAISSIKAANNKIRELPDEFFVAASLREIDVSGNQISTIKVANQITEVTKLSLTRLDMRKNALKSLENFPILPRLKVLLLDSNSIDQPPTLSNLTKLEVLSLERNELINLPEDISFLTRLTELNISHNRITELPDSMSKLSSVKILSISGNQLDELPDIFMGMKMIASLSLHGNLIQALPSSFTNLFYLEYLGMSSNKFTSIPLELLELKKLKTLDIQNNSFSVIPESIESFLVIETIKLTSSDKNETALWDSFQRRDKSFDMSKKGITSLSHFSKYLTRITSLDISNNRFRSFPEQIQYLTNLVKLNASHNMITSIPSFISKLSKLQILTVDYNKLEILEDPSVDFTQNPEEWYEDHEVALPPELCNIRHLETISMKGNPLFSSKTQNIIQELSWNKKESSNDSIERVLGVLELLRESSIRDPCLPVMYDFYATKLIDHEAERSESHRGNYEVPENYIKKARGAKAKYFLSHPNVSKKVDYIWLGKSHDEEERQEMVYIGPGTSSKEYYINQAKENEDSSSNKAADGENSQYEAQDSDTDKLKFKIYDREIGGVFKFFGRIGKFSKSPRGNFYFCFLLYLIYITALAIYATNQNVSEGISSVFFTKTLEDTFNFSQEGGSPLSAGFYRYVEDNFIPAAYAGWSTQGNLSQVTSEAERMTYYRLASPIRIRQLRTKQRQCGKYPPSDLTASEFNMTKCASSLYIGNEDKSNYGHPETFRWKSENDLSGISTYGHQRVWYHGGGFAVDLPIDQTEAVARLAHLESSGWLDIQSRVVFLEALVACDNANLMAYVIQVIEYPASGSNIVSTKIFTLVRPNYGGYSLLNFSVELILIIYALSFFIHEIDQAAEEGINLYMTSGWNWIDASIITFLFATLGLHLYLDRLSFSHEFGDVSSSDDFKIYHKIIRFDFVKQHFLSLLSFFSWSRLLYFLQVQKKFGLLLTVIHKMFGEMIVFLIMIMVFMAAFGTAMYVVVGRNIMSLSGGEDVGYSFGSFMFGELNFEEIYVTSPVLGPMLYFGFLFMFNILLINLLIAVLSHKYEEIIIDSKREYDLVLTDIVLEMQEDALPAPVNLLLPLRPFYRIAKSSYYILHSLLRKPLRWGAHERRECWAHLDYSTDLAAKDFFISYFLPFSHFTDRTDIFSIRVFTFLVDVITAIVGICISLVYVLIGLVVLIMWSLFTVLKNAFVFLVEYMFKEDDTTGFVDLLYYGWNFLKNGKENGKGLAEYIFVFYVNMHRYGMITSAVIFSLVWYVCFLIGYVTRIKYFRLKVRALYSEASVDTEKQRNEPVIHIQSHLHELTKTMSMSDINKSSNTSNSRKTGRDIIFQDKIYLDVKCFGNVWDIYNERGIFYFEVQMLSSGTFRVGFASDKEKKNDMYSIPNDQFFKKVKNPRKPDDIYGVGIQKSGSKVQFFFTVNGRAYHGISQDGDTNQEKKLYPFVEIRSFGGIAHVNLGDKPTKLDFQHSQPSTDSNKMIPYGKNKPFISWDGTYVSFQTKCRSSLALGKNSIPLVFINKEKKNIDSNKNAQGQQTAQNKVFGFMNKVTGAISDFMQLGDYDGFIFMVELIEPAPGVEIIFGFTSELSQTKTTGECLAEDMRRLFCAGISDGGIVTCRKINKGVKIWRLEEAQNKDFQGKIKSGLRLFAKVSKELNQVQFWYQSPQQESCDTLYPVFCIETNHADWQLEKIHPFVAVEGNAAVCHVTFDKIPPLLKQESHCKNVVEVDYSRIIDPFIEGFDLRRFLSVEDFPALSTESTGEATQAARNAE